MYKNIYKNIIKAAFAATAAIAMFTMLGCSQDADVATEGQNPSGGKKPISVVAYYPGQTRATETAFEQGDRLGLFVASDTVPLETGGNLVNNEAMTLNGNSWTASHNLYWDDGSYNAYAYYPYQKKITSIESQPFSVSLDQSTAATSDALSGYESSDLLYASAKGLTASESPISLTFRHVMSKLKIRLIKGEDYEGDLPEDAKVYVHNTVTSATVDLRDGVVSRDLKGRRHTIQAKHDADGNYSAIIVPQRLDNRMPLVEVVVKGVSYMCESRFVFKPGIEHLVNLIINDNPDKVKIEIGGEVKNWQ